MKAKDFKKLRAKVQYYDVEITGGLFGRFEWTFKGLTVLATSHKNACERFNKRNHNGLTVGDETSSEWAYYKVKLTDKISHERHFKYFR